MKWSKCFLTWKNSFAKRAACVRTLLFFVRRERQPGILFVCGSFLHWGGVEKRVRQYAGAWRNQGYKVYISAFYCPGTSNEVSFYLTGNAAKNNCLLKWAIKRKNIKVVEWQAGGSEPPRFDLSLLKQAGVRIGVMVHAACKEWNFNYLKQADYVACSSSIQVQRAPALKDICVLPNAIENRFPVWRYAKQKKAVIISRISEDKIPSLASFIRLCQAWGLAYDIAGPLDTLPAQKVKNILQTKFDVQDSQFLGAVPTEDFLAAHAAEYLFVGGLGQVILEAGQLGYPCLVASLAGEAGNCFVTRDNFSLLYDCNFSPRLGEAAVVYPFCQSLQADFADILAGKTLRFDVAFLVNQHAGLKHILEAYNKLVF